MREKELRLALVCYGGVSLAVYMHGVTKEIWRLARASRDVNAGEDNASEGSLRVYAQLLRTIEAECGIRLRVLPDIISGASAGGINGIFLAHALETGQSLDPLTDLWLSKADADILLDPDARPLSRFTKLWAAPILWMLLRKRGDAVERTVAPETREEVRRKLSNFVRARWFAPPFGGKGFSRLLLDAFEAMAAGEKGPPLLPDGHPLDLFVTVTDFAGHMETLRLNSPPEIEESEHRLTIGFAARGPRNRVLAQVPDLVFAARATASFPGAFPPFRARELDAVLEERGTSWPGRLTFLQRILPKRRSTGDLSDVVLIDGSVLANAPFAPAIAALPDRPARRLVDRRFVYIEPKPSLGGFRLSAREPVSKDGIPRLPGFFRTILGAISDIPREQPIRDNLDTIAERSRRIRRMQHIIEALRPEIETTVEMTVGRRFFIVRPTPARLASWRSKLQTKAAKAAGFAYPAYGHLKLSGVVEDLAALIFTLSGASGPSAREAQRDAIWAALRRAGLDEMNLDLGDGAPPALIAFFRAHDIGFRLRRLRFLARQLARFEEAEAADPAIYGALRESLYDSISDYGATQHGAFFGQTVSDAAAQVTSKPMAVITLIETARDLRGLDERVDARLSASLGALPVNERRMLMRAYLGFPYFDIATLPLLQGEGLDEYDPIKVDRISPDDATAIRSGGAAATLKGIEFNSFGAFFSRAYRENDYLWGRLHGADRMIDIILSTLPDSALGSTARKTMLKRSAMLAILDEEEARLPRVASLIAALRSEIDTLMPVV
jgi:patatin-related protein